MNIRQFEEKMLQYIWKQPTVETIRFYQGFVMALRKFQILAHSQTRYLFRSLHIAEGTIRGIKDAGYYYGTKDFGESSQ